MASVAPAIEVQAAPRAPSLYRFTVAQYHRMIEAGILNENDRVELLEGWVLQKMAHNPPHDATITRINRRLTRLLPETWLVRIQSAVTTSDSEPEPDLAVVRGPEEVYFRRHPAPADIALLVEVADTTLDTDRGEKRRLYARARVSVYWIVNIPEAQVEVYAQPRGGRSPAYRRQHTCRGSDTVALTLDGEEIAQIPAQDLLPPPG
jgi:hypothetical protein